MTGKDIAQKLQDMVRFGYIDKAAAATITKEITDPIVAECAAMRDHMGLVLAVMAKTDDEGGPFRKAEALLRDADIGGAELDYRRALEDSAARVIGAYASQPTPQLEQLSVMLQESPGFFTRSSDLELFLDACAEKVESSADIKSMLQQNPAWSVERDIKRMIQESILSHIDIDVEVQENVQQGQRLSPSAINVDISTIPIGGVNGAAVSVEVNAPSDDKDRLYWLLSEAADDAMDELDGWVSRFDFEERSMEAIRRRLNFHFKHTQSDHIVTTECKITLKES